MCRDEFNKTVRPYVREFRIGRQGIGFDREELDAWVDDYIERAITEKRVPGDKIDPAASAKEKTMARKPLMASTREIESGMSTRSSEVSDFKKALAQATGRKQNSI
ncbi:hypothetical protein [Pseudomonas sp.]|uniref:hypothetical protein n=1 Tax=Pseudomonas sp. TaxID=306 RepID=UPI0039184A6D